MLFCSELIKYSLISYVTETFNTAGCFESHRIELIKIYNIFLITLVNVISFLSLVYLTKGPTIQTCQGYKTSEI
jgi:hypothetical protein